MESHRRGYRGREGGLGGSVRRSVGSIARSYAAFRRARRPDQAEAWLAEDGRRKCCDLLSVAFRSVVIIVVTCNDNETS